MKARSKTVVDCYQWLIPMTMVSLVTIAKEENNPSSSINLGIHYKNVMYPYNELLLTHKKQCCNMQKVRQLSMKPLSDSIFYEAPRTGKFIENKTD